MEEDKSFSWLVIITFLAWVAAIMFATMELLELRANDLFVVTTLF